MVFDVFFGIDSNRVPIEPMVLVEARVFRGDDSVLEIGRDLAERNECVAFVVGLVVNPGLQAPLNVNRGGRRVDPAGGHQGQRGKRPHEHDANEEPSNEGPKKMAPKRSLGSRFWTVNHISE